MMGDVHEVTSLRKTFTTNCKKYGLMGQIVSYFLENWHETKAFAEILEAETRTMREIQCCLNSNQCDLSRNRQEAVDCSVYDSETSNERALLGAELFVVREAKVGGVAMMQGSCMKRKATRKGEKGARNVSNKLGYISETL